MQAYLHKRPAQLAAALAEQRRHAKQGFGLGPDPRWVQFTPPKQQPWGQFMLDALPKWEAGVRNVSAEWLARELAEPVPREKAADRLCRLIALNSRVRSLMYYEGGSVEEFKFLGSGCYAAVFQHPEFRERVIKVGRSNEDGWLGYAKWCVANQGQPMVPKIYELRRVVNNDKVAYVAVMEKLTPLVDDDCSEIGTSRYWQGQLSSLHVFVRNHCSLAFLPDSRAVEAMGRRLYAAFGSQNMDLHTGNAMLNAAGELVITDPYTQSDGTTTQDLPT